MKNVNVKSLVPIVILALMQLGAYAQDSSGNSASSSEVSSTTRTTTTENYWAQPWVWVVGVGVLIVIIVALLRSNSGNDSTRSSKVVVTKTTDV